MEVKKCLHCGATFHALGRLGNHQKENTWGKRVYCSRECQVAASCRRRRERNKMRDAITSKSQIRRLQLQKPDAIGAMLREDAEHVAKMEDFDRHTLGVLSLKMRWGADRIAELEAEVARLKGGEG